MKAVTTALIPSGDSFHFGFGTEDEDIKNAAFAEIERLLRMDRWIPSFQYTISQAALQSKEQLSTKGIGSLPFSDLLLYCREGIFDILRAQAFGILLNLGGLRHGPLIRLVFFTLRMDPSRYIRRRLTEAIARGLGSMALTGNVTTRAGGDEMVIEEDAAQSISVRKDILDRASISGAIDALRKELASDEILKSEIWITAKYVPKISFSTLVVLTVVLDVTWSRGDMRWIWQEFYMMRKRVTWSSSKFPRDVNVLYVIISAR